MCNQGPDAISQIVNGDVDNRTLPILVLKLKSMEGFKEGASHLANKICVPLI